MEGVVDGGERHTDPLGQRFAVEMLRRDMAFTAIEQQFGERQALTGRAQTRRLQTIQNMTVGTVH